MYYINKKQKQKQKSHIYFEVETMLRRHYKELGQDGGRRVHHSQSPKTRKSGTGNQQCSSNKSEIVRNSWKTKSNLFHNCREIVRLKTA